MAGPAQASWLLGFGALSIPLRDGLELKAVGFSQSDVARFVEISRQAWHRFLRAAFDDSEDELRVLSQMVERLEQPRRYPAACLLHPFVNRARSLLSHLPEPPPGDVISVEQRRMFNAVFRCAQTPDQMRDKAIASFVDTELAEMRDLFDTIETHPLTPEQRRAVVVDEDATLILAGAGSGKTSVIVAKAFFAMMPASKIELVHMSQAQSSSSVRQRHALRLAMPTMSLEDLHLQIPPHVDEAIEQGRALHFLSKVAEQVVGNPHRARQPRLTTWHCQSPRDRLLARFGRFTAHSGRNEGDRESMCNLYSQTRSRNEVFAMFRVTDNRAAAFDPQPAIFPRRRRAGGSACR